MQSVADQAELIHVDLSTCARFLVREFPAMSDEPQIRRFARLEAASDYIFHRLRVAMDTAEDFAAKLIDLDDQRCIVGVECAPDSGISGLPIGGCTGHYCRGCGCSELDPCVNDEGEGCGWASEDCCTACAAKGVLR